MDYQKGLYQNEAKQAITDWRSALAELRPKVPFDQDKRDATKVILKDERIANDLFAARKAAHAQEGMDPVTAAQKATQDMSELAKRFGGR